MVTKRNIIVGYHGKCFDGFGAFYYIQNYLGHSGITFNVNYKEMVYGTDLKNDDYWWKFCEDFSLVIFADYCPERKYIDILLEKRCTVLILDHHQTALKEVEDIKDFPFREEKKNFHNLIGIYDYHLSTGTCEAFKVFDMDRSGVGISYDFFHDHTGTRPRLVNYLEDRDLWKFQWHYSREINAYIQSFPFAIEAYSQLHLLLENDYMPAVEAGKTLLRATDKTVEVITKDKLKIVPVFDGRDTYNTAFFNSTSHWSEVGNKVLDQNPDVQISCSVYFDFVKHQVVFSFRSRAGSAIDCSVLAKRLGGGGHRNASGAAQLIGNAMGWLTAVGVV